MYMLIALSLLFLFVVFDIVLSFLFLKEVNFIKDRIKEFKELNKEIQEFIKNEEKEKF